MKHRKLCDRTIYTVVVNFKQSSYEVVEGRGEVMISIILSKSWPESFQVMINIMKDTAISKSIRIITNYCSTLSQMERIMKEILKVLVYQLIIYQNHSVLISLMTIFQNVMNLLR